MKKFFSLLILGSLFTLSACGEQEPEESDLSQDESSQEELVEIEDQDQTSTEDKLEENQEQTGNYNNQNQEPLSLIDGTTSELSTKTYSSDNGYFSFQYPENWELVDSSTEDYIEYQQYFLTFSNGTNEVEISYPPREGGNALMGTQIIEETNFPYESYDFNFKYAEIDPNDLNYEDYFPDNSYNPDARAVIAMIESKDGDYMKKIMFNAGGVMAKDDILTDELYQQDVFPFILHVMSSFEI